MLNLPISVLPEWKSPRINMKIEGETFPVLLDTGAEISAMPKNIMEKFVDCSTLNTHRRCQTFGGYVLTIEGPCYLNVEICGYKLNHPFYVLDEVTASAPIVVGVDLISAVEMILRIVVFGHYGRDHLFIRPSRQILLDSRLAKKNPCCQTSRLQL